MSTRTPLVEGPIDYMKTRLGKAGNAVLARMGDERAKSRLHARVVADKLLRDWKYWSEAADASADPQSLVRFFQQKYGIDLKTELGVDPANDNKPGAANRQEPVFDRNGPVNDNVPANGNAPSNDKYAERRANIKKNFGKPQQASQNISDYQNKTIGELMRAIRANPIPGYDKLQGKEVMTLAHELVKHARDYGGPEKERVKLFLQKLKKDDNTIRKFPGLARLTVESRRHLIDFATYLVETDASTKTGRALLEGYHRFILAEDMSMENLDQFFMRVAKAMIQHNLVKVHPKGQPPKDRAAPTDTSTDTSTSAAASKPNGGAQTDAQGRKIPTFDNTAPVARIKKDAIKDAMHKNGVSDHVTAKILALSDDQALDADKVADALRGLDRDDAYHAMAVLLKTVTFK